MYEFHSTFFRVKWLYQSHHLVYNSYLLRAWCSAAFAQMTTKDVVWSRSHITLSFYVSIAHFYIPITVWYSLLNHVECKMVAEMYAMCFSYVIIIYGKYSGNIPLTRQYTCTILPWGIFFAHLGNIWSIIWQRGLSAERGNVQVAIARLARDNELGGRQRWMQCSEAWRCVAHHKMLASI